MATLIQNIQQVISDFSSIKSALEERNVDADNTPTCEYGNKVLSIKDNQQLLGDILSDNIQEIVLPDSVTSIRKYSFYCNDVVRAITFSDNTEKICKYAFMNCTTIEYLKFGTGLQIIEENAFCNCSKLSEVHFSNNLKSIGTMAFRSCTSLSEIIIPNGVEKISSQAFDGCNKVKKLFLPNSITSLYTNSFMNLSSLVEITVENGFCSDNLTLSASTLLTREALVNILNALGSRVDNMKYTLTLGTNNLAKLTDEDKKIAYAKNWDLK